jgi:hypothetical protein
MAMFSPVYPGIASNGPFLPKQQEKAAIGIRSTWLSLMVDHELLGNNPQGYHVINHCRGTRKLQ